MPSAFSDDLVVTCVGRPWKLKAASADQWVRAVLMPEMAGVFPGMLRGSQALDFFDLWDQFPNMPRRCLNVSMVALARASGREWFWAYNMIETAAQSWPHVNGLLVREGVRADAESLHNWLDACYTLILERKNEEDRVAFENSLTRVPRFAIAAGVKPRMSSRAELMAFAAD